MPSILPTRHGSRTAFVAGLLVLAVALTLALGYQAVDAHRSHRSVVEKAVGEQASFAVWEFAGATQRQLFNYFFRPGLDVVAGSGGKTLDVPLGDVAAPAQVSRDKEWCWPNCSVTLFRVDRRTGRTELLAPGAVGGGEATDGRVDGGSESGTRARARTTSRVPTEAEAALLDSLVAGGPGLIDPEWDQGVRFWGGDRLVAWRWGTDEPTLYGFLAPASILRSALAPVFADTPLLPPVVTAGKRNAELLLARVTSPAGEVLYESHDDVTSPYRARHALGPAFGGMRMEVGLRPEAASALVIGGLPGSRIPGILGLMALTLGLLAIAILQIRRESDLARLRTDFVSSVSHELRTPLAQIRMFAETLMLGRVRNEGEERRSLEILVGETRRLTHLVDNVLLFSRSERGGVRLRRERTDLAAMVREVCETFGPLASASRSELQCEVPSEVWGRVDGDALRQALLNLLDNAVKYGGEGQRIRVGVARLPADRALLWVDDEGRGIPHGRRERVWEPYVRLAEHRDSAIAGSGIGLAVVRRVAEAHDGTVRVEEGEEGGARFLIEIPLEGREGKREAADA